MEVRTSDPATATPIRVEFFGDGTVRAAPATAVVGVIDPRTAQEALTFTDAGGQILTVDELQNYLKQFLG